MASKFKVGQSVTYHADPTRDPEIAKLPDDEKPKGGDPVDWPAVIAAVNGDQCNLIVFLPNIVPFGEGGVSEGTGVHSFSTLD